MDLNSALNLNSKYRDYQNTETRDHDFNKNVSDRIFDIGPMSNRSKNTSVPRPNDCMSPICTYDRYVQPTHSTGSMSREFLQMKHAQEYESLMENPSNNMVSLQQLKLQHTNEIREMADHIQMQHANKYKNLKHMSPDTLNNLHGRQISQNILPKPNIGGIGDVYEQTMYNQQIKPNVVSKLQRELNEKHKKILSQKNLSGIQSYNNQTGTKLEDAYK